MNKIYIFAIVLVVTNIYTGVVVKKYTERKQASENLVTLEKTIKNYNDNLKKLEVHNNAIQKTKDHYKKRLDSIKLVTNHNDCSEFERVWNEAIKQTNTVHFID